VAISKRRAIAFALLSVPLALLFCVLYARFWEAEWLRIRRLRVDTLASLRIVHFSDLHFKGDERYLGKVVRTINAQDVDAVCFTGDLVESPPYLADCLRMLETVRHPLYAVPGNHEYWSGVDLRRIDASLRKTGGGLLINASVRLNEDFSLVGLDDLVAGRPDVERAFEGTTGTRRVVLFHAPATVDLLRDRQFALALSGHSHGGQVRLPFRGALLLPQRVGRYDRGLYRTHGGPLYVTTGVGTFGLKMRFCCRPEIVVIHGQAE
jgi:predicted MPP superfamily phosphohydrolase